jgi:hypothetical protein
LHYIWDPIGISEAPGARDEYRNYLPKVYQISCNENSNEAIVEYLLKIELGSMGLKPNREKAIRVAEILNEYKEKIFYPSL